MVVQVAVGLPTGLALFSLLHPMSTLVLAKVGGMTEELVALLAANLIALLMSSLLRKGGAER